MSRKVSGSYYSKPLAVIHRDFNGLCALCGEPVTLEDASRDHIVPRSRGGSNSRENIQLTHKSCNNLKGDEDYPSDWQAQLAAHTVIPKGYRCSHCTLEIDKWHKKRGFVSKIFKKGRIIALHSWCNEDRIKYGRR